MNIRIFQIHKRSSYIFAEIQDKFSVNAEKKILSLSDGATQGFKSELWAETLTDSFIKTPSFDKKELMKIFTTKAKDFNEIEHDFSENFAIKAVEKRKQELGSFATFMGIQIDEDKINYISSGDVCLFILRAGRIFSSFPFSTVDKLDADKGFLGTEKLIKKEISENTFYQKQFTVNKEDKILLTTDAIARYILKSKDLSILESERFIEFNDFVLQLWETKVLEEDDISLIEISHFMEDEFNIEENLPPENFSFPKEYSHKISHDGEPLFPEQMKELNEIKSQIDQLEKSIKESNKRVNELHNKLKTFKLITFLLLGLLFLTIPMLLWKNFTSKKTEKKIQANSERKISIKNKDTKETVVPNTEKPRKDTLKNN